MKKLIITAVFIFAVFHFSFTQVHTVSNQTNSPGQFTNIQDAINAANPGDTILIHGANYTSITVNKTLTFIGPGHNIQGQFATWAWIPNITLDNVVPTSTASGSKFIGLRIGYINKKSTEQFQIDDIVIERCYISTAISSHVLGDNWVIRNNVFFWSGTNGSLDINNYNNLLIANNIFHGPAGNIQIRSSNKSSVIITNNIFTGHYENITQFNSITNAVFTNNIFFGKSPRGAASSTFEKNITYGNIPSSNNVLPYGTNIGIDNYSNIDPLFVSVPVDLNHGQFNFQYTHDYRLQNNSIGRNNGTDGTDIGIFGGPFPMPAFGPFTITGHPPVPQVYYMHIQNAVIDQNTDINVTIKARKIE